MGNVTASDSRQMATAALQFFARSQMNGAEVDAYMAVRNWLTLIANGKLEVAAASAEPTYATELGTLANPADRDK